MWRLCPTGSSVEDFAAFFSNAQLSLLYIHYIQIRRAHQRFVESCRAYPELFAVLGGQTPDLRGLFLRGHGGNSAALGVQQNDAIRNITGSFGQHSSASAGGVFYRTGGCAEDIRSSYGTWSGNGVGFDLSRVVPTAEENRPVNQAVRYLVRARP